MSRAPLIPARLAFTLDGVPRSEPFDDVYHSADGGPGQARHVFLAGNGLPERWRGRDAFTVLETGFGLGLNFLATSAAFLAHAPQGTRLHYVSVEKHPFSATDLARVHTRWPEFADLSRRLLAAWPPPLPGFHRLDFGRVTLTLLFGDAACLLPQLEARVDAFYLDGFSPEKNPELWSPGLFAQLARLAVPQATLATWTVAARVRTALAEADFVTEKRPGYGRKREMMAGYFAAQAKQATRSSARRALVIGAGLAGTACAERLAARGWELVLVERHTSPAQEASGNPSGILTPVLNRADTPAARLSRVALLYAVRHLDTLQSEGLDPVWCRSGVLRLAQDARQAQRFAQILADHALPIDFVRSVDVDEASRLADWPVPQPGVWYPLAGWAQPASVCTANLARHCGRITYVFGRAVARLEPCTDGWRACAEGGGAIHEAPVLVLASALDAASLCRLPLTAVRGQVSCLPASIGRRLRVPVCGKGYAAPTPEGGVCFGATHQHQDFDPSVRVADHLENLARLDSMLPGFTTGLDAARLEGRVGWRAACPDRLPAFGELPGRRGLFVAAGLGARGLVWAQLGAEIIASKLNGEPLPVERELADSVDPARFLAADQPGG